MSTIPGLHVIGEANFSDHGANRLGASALMQGLADGYFILPYTIGDYLATAKLRTGRHDARPSFAGSSRMWRRGRGPCSAIRGTRTVDSIHRELGTIMWHQCGMARNGRGPARGARSEIIALRAEFWRDGQRARGLGRA